MESVEVYMQQKQWTKYLMCLVGAAIYSVGMNFFVTPAQCYASGVMGVSQILNSVIVDKLHLPVGNFNVTSFLYLSLNLPLFILAFKSIGRQFILKTGINVLATALLMGILPVPAVPFLEERLANAIIGGIFCGFGTGVTLQAGGSTGGLDILGVYMVKKRHDFSVGKLSLIVNGVIYGVCIWLFDVSVAIYSIIYTVFVSMVADRGYTQSINVEAMIFTKTDGEEISNRVIRAFNRSATIWKGIGGYTDKDTVIIYAVLSKYEATLMRRLVKEIDPHAFIVFNEGCHIDGNFPRHL